MNILVSPSLAVSGKPLRPTVSSVRTLVVPTAITRLPSIFALFMRSATNSESL